MRRTDAVGRVLAKCLTRGECWVYPTSRPDGYAQIMSGGRMKYVHRLTYEYFRADIPEGLHLDHLCRIRSCCNPWHLEPVTQRENNRRMVVAMPRRRSWQATDQCIHGHPRSEATTYWTASGRPDCRICKRESKKRWRERQKSR